MHPKFLSLMLTLAVLAAPAFGSMRYAPVAATAILTPVDPLHPQPNNFSGCSSTSNTIAVGYEIYSGGFRMLCADAGEIGFWTATIEAPLVGQAPQPGEQFLCPSGTALGGLRYVEGLAFPLPLCGELIPDLVHGFVQRHVLVSIDNVVEEKEAKGPPQDPADVTCGPAGYVQTLQASRNAAGQVAGFGLICNSIQTDIASSRIHVDLAVKTIGQTAELGRSQSQLFQVAVFNLGSATVAPSNLSLELRFDGEAWDIVPFSNMSCTDILGHAGLVDLLTIGKRCTITGSVSTQDGGIASVNFQLVPVGPDSLRPATPTAQPVFSVKAGLLNESLEGADFNPANDTAAFPVVLR